MDKDMKERLDRIEDELTELKKTIYGYDTKVGLLGQIYELKKRLQIQNKLIFLLLTLQVSQFALLAGILLKGA